MPTKPKPPVKSRVRRCCAPRHDVQRDEAGKRAEIAMASMIWRAGEMPP